MSDKTEHHEILSDLFYFNLSKIYLYILVFFSIFYQFVVLYQYQGILMCI